LARIEKKSERIDELQIQTRELQQETRELQQQTKELRSESLKHEIKNDVLLKEGILLKNGWWLLKICSDNQ